VVHAVGPVWRGGKSGEPELLASCYRESLALAAAHGATSIAFPAISTGAFAYPVKSASEIAVRTCLGFLEQHPAFSKIVLVAYKPSDAAVLSERIQEARERA
jgi:O-acetyl-ADP-ribose deacetylase (regulator of RNase III)